MTGERAGGCWPSDSLGLRLSIRSRAELHPSSLEWMWILGWFAAMWFLPPTDTSESRAKWHAVFHNEDWWSNFRCRKHSKNSKSNPCLIIMVILWNILFSFLRWVTFGWINHICCLNHSKVQSLGPKNCFCCYRLTVITASVDSFWAQLVLLCLLLHRNQEAEQNH